MLSQSCCQSLLSVWNCIIHFCLRDIILSIMFQTNWVVFSAACCEVLCGQSLFRKCAPMLGVYDSVQWPVGYSTLLRSAPTTRFYIYAQHDNKTPGQRSKPHWWHCYRIHLPIRIPLHIWIVLCIGADELGFFQSYASAICLNCNGIVEFMIIYHLLIFIWIPPKTIRWLIQTITAPKIQQISLFLTTHMY